MTAIEEARAALAEPFDERYASRQALVFRDRLRALIAEVERLSVPPSDDDRETLIAFMHARNRFDYDECEHGTYTGGPSHGEPYAMCERQANAILAAGFRRQGPITDEVVEAAMRDIMLSPEVPTGVRPHLIEGGVLVIRERTDVEPIVRIALEAAERARSAVPCVECSGTGWLAAYQRDGSATADSCRDCGGSGLRAAVPSTTEQESE